MLMLSLRALSFVGLFLFVSFSKLILNHFLSSDNVKLESRIFVICCSFFDS